ncbi:MAG: NAD(P)H-binding protein [Acidobacteria bacterium]|nr:NAD(P)H-binding protein [Acidobacteriota bacterium]
MGERKALVAGATGLVGGHLVRLLAQRGPVLALVRRDVPLPEGAVARRVDFDALVLSRKELAGADVYCALGTTIRKAGSQAAFRKVDLEAVANLARAAARGGARFFGLVSAVGADPSSSVFYSRVKGEAEAAVRASGVPGVGIVRPSFLLGERAESRPAEKLGILAAKALGFAMVGPLARYRAVEAEDVARALIGLAGGEPGVRIVESEEIGLRAAPPRT